MFGRITTLIHIPTTHQQPTTTKPTKPISAITPPTTTEIRVCTNRTCRRQGSTEVLQVLQGITPPNISITSCGCLGRCGSGPNLVVLPSETFVSHCGTAARAADVMGIVCGVDSVSCKKSLEALMVRKQAEVQMEKGEFVMAESLLTQSNAQSSKVMGIIPKVVRGFVKTETVDSSDLRALRILDPMGANMVMRLSYSNFGSDLLVLSSSRIIKLWHGPKQATASIVPRFFYPTNGALMSNHLNESIPAEETVTCIALTKNDSYVVSASGGKISVFNTMTSKRLFTLKGHKKQIAGLAFSQALSSLVSSAADAKLCMWNIKGWKKLKSTRLQSPPGYPSSLVGDTKVQYHNDQHRLLVVHESQIVIYDPQLECLKLWSPREPLSAPISSAIYSCDGLQIFTGFLDCAVGVFDAESLSLRCRIQYSAYNPPSIYSNDTAYPRVIAAHPSDPNQFALGMSDGSVHVIEPADADPKQGGTTPQEDGSSASSNPSELNSQPLETIQMMVQNMKI